MMFKDRDEANKILTQYDNAVIDCIFEPRGDYDKMMRLERKCTVERERIISLLMKVKED